MEFIYTLVADSETNIKEGKLAVNSPIGKGLLGKEVGDVVEIKVPNGILNFDRLTINAAGDSEITMNVKCSHFTLNNLESANLNLSVNTDEGIITTNKTGRAKINLKSEKMEIFSKGNSTTELTGTTTELIVHAENKSNLKAEGLESDEITVTASDNSDIHVNAKNSIIISAINSAEIYIYNKPKISIDKFIDKAILRKK